MGNGIHSTGLRTGVQNSLQNWKILKIGQVMFKNSTKKVLFFFYLTQSNFHTLRFCQLISIQKFKSQFYKFFKLFIFTYTSHFYNIRPHLRGTFLNFVKNVSYKHALEFQVK